MSLATVFLVDDRKMIEFYGKKDYVKVVADLIREDKYNKAVVLEVDQTGEDAAEEMFDLSNNPYRDHERSAKWGQHRSLSVGDVVMVDDVSYLCSSIGWTKL